MPRKKLLTLLLGALMLVVAIVGIAVYSQITASGGALFPIE